VEATQTVVAPVQVVPGVSVIIERSPEVVFAAVTDIAGHTAWAKGAGEIADISDNPVRLGTTWQQTMRVLGKKVVNRMKVNTYEQNRKFGYGSEKPLPMDLLLTLTPVPAGTEVTMSIQGEPSNFFGKVALPILSRSVEGQVEADLYTLKAILENGA
jgi:uncharacterized protein YndB with AHSA1/START domain